MVDDRLLPTLQEYKLLWDPHEIMTPESTCGEFRVTVVPSTVSVVPLLPQVNTLPTLEHGPSLVASAG